MIEGCSGVIGATSVFAMFLDACDVLHLSRSPKAKLTSGRPVFPDVPLRPPEEILACHGLSPGSRQRLDAQKGLTLVSRHRAAPRVDAIDERA